MQRFRWEAAFALERLYWEMTQIGKECHNHCQIYQRMGECIMPREGVFARVLRGGSIKTGDKAELLPLEEKRPYTAAVITLSDKGAKGEREDKTWPADCENAEGSRISGGGNSVAFR